MPATLTIDGAEVAQELTRIRNVVADGRAVLAVAAEYIADTTEYRFRSGGDPTWKDIKPRSRQNRRSNKTTPPLTDTGALRESVTQLRAVPYGLFSLTQTELVIGTFAPGARALQEGYSPRNLVARPFLYLTDHDDEVIGRLMDDRMKALILGK